MKLPSPGQMFRSLGPSTFLAVCSLSASATAPLAQSLERPLALSSDCPGWIPTFGAFMGLDESVRALVVHDDGTGAALYVGGSFTTAGGLTVNGVAKWDGSNWSALGGGMGGVASPYVAALAVYDDGSGPALYAGGSFTTAGRANASFVAKWNGRKWQRLSGETDGPVNALVVYDDGNGPALYVGGSFTAAGGLTANGIAKWDGSSWSALGSGLNNSAFALAVYDDGSGPALYAGGLFLTAGDQAARGIAKWDGSNWSDLGSGVAGTGDAYVGALAMYDDGSGPALYAGGEFTAMSGVPANRIAQWNGSSWSALGSGMNDKVSTLTVYDDGGGAALCAGGQFTATGAEVANRIAKWNGSIWTALDGGLVGEVQALAAFDDGTGPALYAGGSFSQPTYIAKWQDSKWLPLGKGMTEQVRALGVYDDGGGPALYAGGYFVTAGGVPASRIAKWDGSSWSTLGSGVNSVVHALATYDDGSGPALYAGGVFTIAGGESANKIAKWDGVRWSPLVCCLGGQVNALAVYDDGGGPALYVGGTFTSVAGVPANRIAKWDGSSWSALGNGLNNNVFALAVYDDGSGPALYAGGIFWMAGGVLRVGIARWDGSSWTDVGNGIGWGSGMAYVRALTVLDDGSGPALYAGGRFSYAGDTYANNLARWDGSSWSALGDGTNESVTALASYSDANGAVLVAGGSFTNAGGLPANRIAAWNGSSWTALGSGMNGRVLALSVFDDGSGAALYAGGDFTSAYDSNDAYLAKWGCPQVVLDFSTEDDFATPLGNGQVIDTEFGRLLRISGAGANAGPTTFDTTPGGPNDPAINDDMLIGHGNVLLLEDDWYSFAQTVPGFFDVVTDDPHGGDLIFDFLQPVDPRSMLLADINPPPNLGASVTLTDGNGQTRVYAIEPGWTGGYGNAGPWRLDLTTTVPQPGNGTPKFATATEDPGFLQSNVVQMAVHMTGFGAVDDLSLRLPQASATTRNGSGGNPMILRSGSRPVLGSTWNAELDCSAYGSGLAMLVIRRRASSGTMTPFGEVLIGGDLLFRETRTVSTTASAFTWHIPNDMALLGLDLHVQGACQEAPAAPIGKVRRVRGVLSNALDLILGF